MIAETNITTSNDSNIIPINRSSITITISNDSNIIPINRDPDPDSDSDSDSEKLIISEHLKELLDRSKQGHDLQKKTLEELKNANELLTNLEDLKKQLAHKEDLLKIQNQVCKKIEKEATGIKKDLDYKIKILQDNLSRYIPHKVAFRNSAYCLSFFLLCHFFYILFGLEIIKPFWAMLGIFISSGFLIMSYFLYLDWKESIESCKKE